MKPVQYVAGWTDVCRLSERARAISAVAQDGHRRARRRAEAMQHTPQLLLLPVRLAGTLLKTTDLPSSPLTWATKTSKERIW